MPPDDRDVRTFLAVQHPFDLLAPGALSTAAAAVLTVAVARGSAVEPSEETSGALLIVEAGAIEARDPDGRLIARLGEGECLTADGIGRVHAIEDSRLLRLPGSVFEQLRAGNPAFAAHFGASPAPTMVAEAPVTADLRHFDTIDRPVGALLTRGPVTIGTTATVGDAARRMRDENVSSLLVTAAGGPSGEPLLGILTDRDLRSRVVAEEIAYDTPIERVMTRNPHRVRASETTFDAVLLMTRHNIHHLPVTDDAGGTLLGCLTGSALIRGQTASPLFHARTIHECGTAEEMRTVIAQVPDLVQRLADRGATARSIGRIVAALTDTVTLRLLELAESRLGPPPVPYVWLALGSQGRQEQTALSDQDNALLIDDGYDEATHAPWFAALGRFVCDGLNTCGYVYCPGEMMAVTEKYRQPLSVWKKRFGRWINEPEPMALMLSSVFFDLRPVAGTQVLFTELHGMILETAKANRIFQAYMARNALTHEPPLGFFRNFVLVHGGDHHHTLDLKHRGVVPITDLARVYALAAGVAPVNTVDRLSESAAARSVSRDMALDLTDALEFIALTRIRHQARRIQEGKPADNFLAPQELSGFERGRLKAAFAVVKTAQAALSTAYQLGRF